MNSLSKALIPIAVIVILALALLSSLFVVIEAGHVGVVKRLGAVQPEALKEGFHFKQPFVDQIDQVDMRLLYINAKATAASKDLQTVSAEVNVAFSLNGALAPLVYQRVGSTANVAAALVEPAIQESIKAITAQYTAEELVTKRAIVKQAIQQAITTFIDNTLKEKGIGNAVQLANVAITDFAFSEEFNRAIEAKVKAEQEALRAKNEKIMRVTQAEASAAERKLSADAEAYSTEVQSKARADAIKREAESLRSSPEIIQLRAVEKWDGTLPRIQGSGVLPFMNIGSLGGEPSPSPAPAGN
ncbi:MAG: prohibitin family protein [Terrimicrobiaceae bacterium]|nr:prohibitin family protein [Terrimicrobiaceae bacterium]